MSQPINEDSDDYFNNISLGRYPHSQPINNNISQMMDNPQLSQNKDIIQNNNDNDNKFIYELVFNVVSNVSLSDKTNEIKIKIIRIIIKIIENIVNAEINHENSEKYRKIKIGNPNISLIFEIHGNYDFIKLLGFEEEFYEQELCLYLPKENINIPFFQKLLSYIELLLLNFQEDENNEQNYYEVNQNDNNFPYINEEDYKNNNDMMEIDDNKIEDNKIEENKIEENNYQNKDIMQILKETKDVRLGYNNMNMEYGDNWNMRPQGPSREGAKILKETGRERYQNALLYSHNLNYNGQNWNMGNNNSFNPNIHTFDDFNSSSSNQDDKFFKGETKRTMSLNDLEFHNPTDLRICKDEIGKKCLELTNIFRAKHKLPPLKWDDSIWRISYGHSKNMGDKKVPFGHKGFNERIRRFPFYYTLACENVFMCHGYSQYSIAQMGVDGWINSPGHRKNLLSNTTHCAIATYRNSSGAFYLTQMFARK
jgi:uncharacterized protein YkwD